MPQDAVLAVPAPRKSLTRRRQGRTVKSDTAMQYTEEREEIQPCPREKKNHLEPPRRRTR